MSPDIPRAFVSKITLIGSTPFISIPKDVSSTFKETGPIPVIVHIKSLKTRATLAPIGHNRYRLYITGAMRRGAKIGVGDTVLVSLEYDGSAKEMEIPDELARELKAKNVYETFLELSPSRRKEMLEHYNRLKSEEVKAKAAAIIILGLERVK